MQQVPAELSVDEFQLIAFGWKVGAMKEENKQENRPAPIILEMATKSDNGGKKTIMNWVEESEHYWATTTTNSNMGSLIIGLDDENLITWFKNHIDPFLIDISGIELESLEFLIIEERINSIVIDHQFMNGRTITLFDAWTSNKLSFDVILVLFGKIAQHTPFVCEGMKNYFVRSMALAVWESSKSTRNMTVEGGCVDEILDQFFYFCLHCEWSIVEIYIESLVNVHFPKSIQPKDIFLTLERLLSNGNLDKIYWLNGFYYLINKKDKDGSLIDNNGGGENYRKRRTSFEYFVATTIQYMYNFVFTFVQCDGDNYLSHDTPIDHNCQHPTTKRIVRVLDQLVRGQEIIEKQQNRTTNNASWPRQYMNKFIFQWAQQCHCPMLFLTDAGNGELNLKCTRFHLKNLDEWNNLISRHYFLIDHLEEKDLHPDQNLVESLFFNHPQLKIQLGSLYGRLVKYI